MEEGEIWGRGGGNIFSLVTTHGTACIPLLAMQIHYVYIVGRNNVEISKLQS